MDKLPQDLVLDKRATDVLMNAVYRLETISRQAGKPVSTIVEYMRRGGQKLTIDVYHQYDPFATDGLPESLTRTVDLPNLSLICDALNRLGLTSRTFKDGGTVSDDYPYGSDKRLLLTTEGVQHAVRVCRKCHNRTCLCDE